jgi:hypothetical protein
MINMEKNDFAFVLILVAILAGSIGWTIGNGGVAGSGKCDHALTFIP